MIEGELLRDARQFVLRITQHELAELLGVSLRTVGNWERGGVPTSREHVVRRAINDALEDAQKRLDDWEYQAAVDPSEPDPDYLEALRVKYESDLRDAAIFTDYAEIEARQEKANRLKQFTFNELVEEIQSRYDNAIAIGRNKAATTPEPTEPDTESASAATPDPAVAYDDIAQAKLAEVLQSDYMPAASPHTQPDPHDGVEEENQDD